MGETGQHGTYDDQADEEQEDQEGGDDDGDEHDAVVQEAGRGQLAHAGLAVSGLEDALVAGVPQDVGQLLVVNVGELEELGVILAQRKRL